MAFPVFRRRHLSVFAEDPVELCRTVITHLPGNHLHRVIRALQQLLCLTDPLLMEEGEKGVPGLASEQRADIAGLQADRLRSAAY